MIVDTVIIKASVATNILRRNCVKTITSKVNVKTTNALTDILNHVSGSKRKTDAKETTIVTSCMSLLHKKKSNSNVPD